MTLEQPLFLENEKWYYYDNNTKRYVLTDEAPQEAIQSYKLFYNSVDNETYY